MPKTKSVPRLREDLERKRADIRECHNEIRRYERQFRAMEIVAIVMVVSSILLFPLIPMIATILISAMFVEVGERLSEEMIEKKKYRLARRREDRHLLAVKMTEKRNRIRAEEEHQKRLAAAKLERKQQKMCGNKIQHATRQDAVEHRAELNRKDGGKMNIYPCTFCNHYHVGHDPKTTRPVKGMTHRPFANLSALLEQSNA
jgi:hypothetical protein